MTMLLRSLLATVAFATVLSAPASAQPVLAALNPCYVVAQDEDAQREPVAVIGSGFSPTQPVDIYIDEIAVQEAPLTDFDGNLNGAVRAPFIEEGERPFTLRVTERVTTTNTVTVSSLVTRLSVTQSPKRAATRDRVTFRGRGFRQFDRPVYAHYVFAGKVQKTINLGLPTGACGLFSVKRKQFPFKNSPRRGLWTIQFDQERVYNPRAATRVPLTVRVTKQVKPRRAQAR